MTDKPVPAAEHPVVDAAELLDSIIASAMDGILTLDARQRIVLFNPAAEKIFGYRAADVLGQPVDVLLPERYRAAHRELVELFGRDAIQTRRMGGMRTVLARRASGEEFPIEASISHTTINGERIYTAIVRDVAEAVRYRQRIEEQSQMLDQVSDAVSAVDLQGRITFWNPAAERLYGWSAAEALGQNAVELLYRGDPDDWVKIQREIARHDVWVGELSKVTRDGKPLVVEHRRTALRDAAGNIRGYVCIDIDLTQRRKWERAQRRSQRLESIGTLASGIAHDLNNVLTPILMGAKALAAGRAVHNRQALLETMVSSAERGAALVHQLLKFAGGVRGERTPVAIKPLVTEAVGMLEHTLPKSIRIETHIAADLPPVLGDVTELSQVLMNLCINARDAMPNGGLLSIEAKSVNLNGTAIRIHPDAYPGQWVMIKVADTGCGMTPGVLERIFDPFFTTKEMGKGTGLGLATVQGIVKSHRGFITVYSEPGMGSTFSIYLPVAESPAAADQPTPSTLPEGRGRTVLLVDDEPLILQTVAALLEEAGYRVLTAPDGGSALALFRERQPEITAVLLDMMMPGMDGLEVLAALRRMSSRVPIIACSGLRTAQREALALEHGATAYLPKPYSEEDLRQALARVIEQRDNPPT